MITALTWLWKQPGSRTVYNELHVAIWADMVSRNLTLPHELACVTEHRQGIPPNVRVIDPPHDFDAIRIPTWRDHRPQCLRRLAMFRKDAAELFGGDRLICFDLDCVIGGSLDSLFAGDEDFRIAKGTAPSRPYNGSLISLRAGSRTSVYDQFTPEGAAEAGRRFVGSDQAWLAHILGPDEPVWTADDGLAFHGASAAEEPRIKFYPGSTKPWDAKDEWTRRHYRRVRTGKCLILGYGPSLWRDVGRVLDGPKFEAVIASPEAAEHWSGDLLAVAGTNSEAAHIAFMHGFDDVTWCGVAR